MITWTGLPPVRRAVAAAFLLAVAACGNGVQPPEAATAVTPASASASATAWPSWAAGLAVREGDRVVATGRVVAVPGRPVRLCAPVAQPLVGYLPGAEPAPAYCTLGVDVVGVDMGTLAMSRTKGGATEGQATLEGTFRAGALTVESQRPPAADEGIALPVTPPCPAPPGGWPISSADPANESLGGENMEPAASQAYGRANPGVIADIASLRPSARQVLLLVLVNSDVAGVDAALRAAYGERLCVVRAEHTAEEVDRVREEVQKGVASEPSRLGIYMSGETLSASGQMVVNVDAVMVTDELLAMVARYPAGIIDLRPWLRPVQ